jgi:hypothetical protein
LTYPSATFPYGRERETDGLVAGFLRMAIQLERLLQSEQPLTQFRQDCLRNGIRALDTYLNIWLNHFGIDRQPVT